MLNWVLISLFIGLNLPAEEVEEDHVLSPEFETPHTEWAKPYGRKCRVFYFSSGRDTHAREIIELMQRFPIEADAVYWTVIVDTPEWQWHGGEAGLKRIYRLLENDYDCYIFNQISISNLPQDAQEKILKSVRGGAGIVSLGENEEVLKKEGKREGEGYRIGEGRGVKLPPPPVIPYRFGWEVAYDYWQERFGRAVMWASKMEPDTPIEIEVPGEIARAELIEGKAKPLTIHVSGGLNSGELTGRIRREEDGEEIELRLKPDEGIPLPPLRSGKYHVDVWLKEGGIVRSWATRPFEVSEDRKIELNLEREWAEVGEEIKGEAILHGGKGGEAVEIRLKDRRGRVLSSRRSPYIGSAPFRFKVERWFPMLVQIEAIAFDPDGEICSATAYVHVPKRHRRRFNLLVWDYPRGPTAPYAEEALAKLGMTLQLGGGPPLFAAAYDVAWVPYTIRILAPLDERGYMKPVCWNDEPAVDEYVRGIAERWRPARIHGVFVYSLGDETVTRGSCMHPACLKAYRRYLKEQYVTIERLNDSWGTNYSSFDEVEVRDNDEETALKEGNFPRWFDRQAFKSYNFVMFCKRFGKAYRELDPMARTGFEGAGRFDRGDDFDLIVRTNGFWTPYPGPGDEVIRSIAPKDFPRSNWMGYRKDADSLLRRLWRTVTRGCDSVWWWRWDNIGRFHGLLRPDLVPFPDVKEMMKDTKPLWDGLGDLLINSEMLDDGIAILYSLPSAYATRVENGSSYGDYQSSHISWHRAIRNLGLQFRYVTDRMLRLGEWEMDRYRVLILSRAEALSDEEARLMRRFVEGGGVLVADLRPGIFDDHCKPLESGKLDGLFGVRRTGRGKAVQGDGRLERLEARFLCDPEIKLSGGEAMGEMDGVPLMVTRRIGKGRALLLNFSLSELSEEKAVEVMKLIAEMARIKPKVRVEGKNGEPIRGVEIVRWRTGEIEIVALFEEEGEPIQVRTSLQEPRHVYDLRERRYLGELDRFELDLKPGRAYFLALLPKPAPDVVLSAPREAERGEAVKVQVAVPGSKGLHAVKLKAYLPEGGEAGWFERIAVVGDEPETLLLPIALNDPVGTWKVQAVDLYSGKTSEIEMEVSVR
jgi:hypothetical protein